MATVDAPRPKGRRRTSLLLWLIVFPLGALSCVLLARAAGIAPARLQPVAEFLAVAAAASILFRVLVHVAVRRARRQRNLEVRWGVRLEKPLWMSSAYLCLALAAGALVGAVVAAIGFPGVGFGVSFTLAAFGACAHVFDHVASARGLTFERNGLRVHLRGGSFVVPWTSMTKTEAIGPPQIQMTRVQVKEPSALADSAEPDNVRLRARIAMFVDPGPGAEGRLTFAPWTAGLHGSALLRTIDAAVSGQLGRVN